ncbi:diablo, IAP-binding mitochondrial protein a [Denticeps clupeoides]|uniref:Direct IAP-binding protein with low pI n=1 Tax=Denticeps clupeoides TaxID=299321 RepID=A0AAY4B290_9TELE|nr:diablo homolog, mitochondrial [Denticeps clupeoides]
MARRGCDASLNCPCGEMQVARHHCVCLGGAAARSRTHFLLRTGEMASLRRAAACFSFARSAACALTSDLRYPRQRLLRLAGRIRTDAVSLSLGAGLCAVPFTQQAENLSHDALIRRASSLLLDSANTFLSQTTLALVDSLTQYTKALHTLVALQKRYLASMGKLSPAEEDAVWQVIIGQRVEVGDRLDECRRFEANWTSAVQLCEAAAEAAYSAGIEQASLAARATVQLAQTQVGEVRRMSAEAERQLAEAKAEEIQRMAELASTAHINVEDIPEAYLRED